MNQDSKQDDAFEKKTRALLEESTTRLDGHTLSRLTQARHAALNQLQRPVWLGWRALVPTGAAAAAVLAVVMLLNRPGAETSGTIAQNVNSFEDMELLADADAPDFVDDGEDLEFYEWAADEKET